MAEWTEDEMRWSLSGRLSSCHGMVRAYDCRRVVTAQAQSCEVKSEVGLDRSGAVTGYDDPADRRERVTVQ